MKNLIVRFVREEEGQDLVEYALLITFIALACIIGMQNLGTAINNKYNAISASLDGATGVGNVAVCQPVAVSLVKVTWAIRCPVGLHNDPTWVPVFVENL